ncbi:excalibur calcium-binding domain-containing protein, partial [Nocardia gipuzkoensis]
MNVRRLIVTVSAGLVTLAAPLAPTALADPFIPTGSAGTGSSGIDDLIGATGSAGLAQTGSAGGPVYKNCDEAR